MAENTPAVYECSERHDRVERRNMLLMISAVLQWLLTLVCIVYLVMLYHLQPPEKGFVTTELMTVSDASKNCPKIMVEKKDGTMKVENGTIVIPSSGHYWVYIQGLVNDKDKTGEITFHFKHPGNDTDKWKEEVKNGHVRAILFKELYYQSEVYITTCGLKFEQFQLTVYTA